MKKPFKIIFAGSPEYAVPSLEALHKKYGVAAVITQPDKPSGRKKIPAPTAVKAKATELGIPVYDFVKIRENADEVKLLGADVMITCAYGQLLTQQILDCFPLGVWNLHASLLPEFRGASPIQSAILAGKTHTGVTVMKTELSVDTGDILLVKRCEINNKNYGELSAQLSVLSAEAAVEAVEYLLGGDPLLLMQDEAKATHCKKIQKSDGKINFNDSPEDICRLIRAYNPEPVAFCNFGGNVLNVLRAEPCDSQSVNATLKAASSDNAAKINSPSDKTQNGTVICADKRGITVACGQGAIVITELQPSGGKRMSACDFVNGRKIKAGDRLD